MTAIIAGCATARKNAQPAIDYGVCGRAIGGFAVVAYLARYGSSGIMTFMIDQDGRICRSGPGPDAPSRASGLRWFDRGQGRSPVTVR